MRFGLSCSRVSPLFIHRSNQPTEGAYLRAVPQPPSRTARAFLVPRKQHNLDSTVVFQSTSKTDTRCQSNDGADVRVGRVKRTARQLFRLLRRRGLPESKSWEIPDSATSLRKQALKFVQAFALETSLAAAVLCMASYPFAKGSSKFVTNNLSRWIVLSILVKMGVFYSRINASVPSLARHENNDWFLTGSYTVELGDETLSARVRQVPGNGCCLFHAVASGILYELSGSNESDVRSHPRMSEVIAYSSVVRTLAVDILENGMNGGVQLVMQDDETISASSLVNKAAAQYGMSPQGYLNKMRKKNVWGGGPEIVALANHLERQIVLLEPVHDEAEAIHLKAIASFGPPSHANPIYILSTNISFPRRGFGRKKSNHFLAVFPDAASVH